MEQNKALRSGVLAHLTENLPGNLFKTSLDDWRIVSVEETPLLMVYLEDGELDSQYMESGEKYSGVLQVSIYLGTGTTDALLDEMGEQIKLAMPVAHRIEGLATLYRRGFRYERSEDGVYRALHLNHIYRLE
ncbi:phage tail terminator protein [Vibrio sp. CB1-14]|uniref:Phage tail terminator protein n=1 Tax=Vibrio chaetopteri TaxID=3016528 RepID=A0AAU8BRF4_9VIBR